VSPTDCHDDRSRPLRAESVTHVSGTFRGALSRDACLR
jgi:hypothetical protein